MGDTNGAIRTRNPGQRRPDAGARADPTAKDAGGNTVDAMSDDARSMRSHLGLRSSLPNKMNLSRFLARDHRCSMIESGDSASRRRWRERCGAWRQAISESDRRQ